MTYLKKNSILHMKKTLFLLYFLILLFDASAQTQQGYVKTKGRLANNGTVIQGTRLSGAMVTVKGRNAVLSGSNGTFVLSIPSSSYYLQNVQKQGYVITDPDVLSRQYSYSKNPLVLVLETQEQQADDKLAAERKIRRTLQRQLQNKEDEIEALKEQKKLSEEEYRKQLQEIYALQKSNENLINDMADRYSKMDFDKIDEFNRKITSLILEGRLTEADSILNTKGDINSRISVLRQHQEANVKAEQEIKVKQKKLEKNKDLTNKELEDLALDCYSKFEIFKMQHQNDSAAYYIELRASLDTTNIEWGMSAGKFYQKYMASYTKAESYYNRCLTNALASGEDHKYLLPGCYEALASIYSARGELDKSLVFHQKDNEISESLFGKHHPLYMATLISIANIYRKKGDFDKAIKISSNAAEIIDSLENYSLSSKVKIYGNIANLYSSQNQHLKALEYYQYANRILDTCKVKYPLETITTYTNIGHTYFELGDYNEAINWDSKAYDLIKKTLGDSHPEMGTILSNTGAVYLKQKQPQKALENVKKCLEIDINIYGKQSPNLIVDYNNLGMIQSSIGLKEEALDSYNVSLDLCTKHLANNHPYFATLYNNIGSVYTKIEGKDDIALNYFDKALQLRISKFGEKNSSVAIVYQNIAEIYKKRGNNENALNYFKKAKDIYTAVFGENNPKTHAVIEEIVKLKSLNKNK